MVMRFQVGDSVRIVRPYVSCLLPRGRVYGKRLLNKLNATGIVVEANPRHGIRVKWDVPYREMTHSGWRKPMRFEFGDGPW